MRSGKRLLPLILGCFLLSGCGSSIKLPSLLQSTPTPAITPVETKVPETTLIPEISATPTPAFSPTAAPRMIGRKTTSAGSAMISNSTGTRFRQLFLQVSGTGDWGRNLIPSEGSIRVSEQFTLYYPEAVNGNTYDLRLRDDDGTLYEIYGVDLTDIDSAVLRKDDEDVVYLSYMSKNTKSEKDTRGSSWNNNPGNDTYNVENSWDSWNGAMPSTSDSEDYSSWNEQDYYYDTGSESSYDDSDWTWDESEAWDYESE